MGLRVDPEKFAQTGVDELGSFRDEAGKLVKKARAGVESLTAAADEALASPAELVQKVESLIAEVQTIRYNIEGAAGEEADPAAQALKELKAVQAKLDALLALVEEAREDDSKTDEILNVLTDAGADYTMLLNNLSSFSDRLGDYLYDAQEAFSLLPEATADVQEKKWDDVKEKLSKTRAALDPVRETLGESAEEKETLDAPLRALLETHATLPSEVSQSIPSVGDAPKVGRDKLHAAADLLAEGKNAEALTAIDEALAKFNETTQAAAEAAAEGGGIGVSLAQDHRKVVADLEDFISRLRARTEDESFGVEGTVDAVIGAITSLDNAVASLNGATVTIEEGSFESACPACNDAVDAIEEAGEILADEAEKISGGAEDLASIEPNTALFLEPFVKGLKAFEMFHAAEGLVDVPVKAPMGDFLAAAKAADADFLVMVEPSRNDIVFVGHSKNWFCSFCAWSFAWFVSNWIPDEKWESRLTLDLNVVDLRSQETLFTRAVDSTTTMNLTDIDDGYHFLGILTGSVDREDLESAYECVLPYHMLKVQGDLLESLAVDFRAYTATEEFTVQRNKAEPQGFGAVVGVGTYASDAFSAGVPDAKEKTAAWTAAVRESSQTLGRVASALLKQIGEKGSSGAPDTVEALQKAKKLFEMAATEFKASDRPAGIRSLTEGLAALKEAKSLLASADPPPANVYEVGERIDLLMGNVGKASEKANDFATPAGAADLGKRVAALAPEMEAVPETLRTTAEKIGEEGAPLTEAAPKMEGALQNLRDAETALGSNDLPTGLSVLETVLTATAEALAAVEPLKPKAIEAASVAGKLSYLKIEIEKALNEAKALPVPGALTELAGECTAIGDGAEGVIQSIAAEGAQAEARVKDRRAVAEAAAPAAETLAGAAGLLEDATAFLNSRETAKAAEKIEEAARVATKASATMGDLVKDLPTFVGEILDSLEALKAIVSEQRALVSRIETTGPKKEDLGDLPEQQRKVGQELNTFAGEIEALVAPMRDAGKPEADEVQQCAGALRKIAETVEGAAQNLELLDVPATLAAQEEAKEKMAEMVGTLEKLAGQTAEIGKHAFAMKSAVSRQEALILQSNSLIDMLREPLEPLAAEQDGILVKGSSVVSKLSAIPGVFPKAKEEEPGLLLAVKTAAEDLGSALSRGAQGCVMFRKGDALGGKRELTNLLTKLLNQGNALAAAVKGKRSHVDWIKQAVVDLSAFAAAGPGMASALQAGGSRMALDRANQDAENMAAYLTDAQGAGFAPARVKTLVGQNATREGIENLFDDLLKNRVLENDLFVFYFAGCGGLKRIPVVKEQEILGLQKRIDGDAAKIAEIIQKAKEVKAPTAILELATEAQERQKAMETLSTTAKALSDDAAAGPDARRVEAFAQSKDALQNSTKALEDVIAHLDGSAWAEAETAAPAAREVLRTILPPVGVVLDETDEYTDLVNRALIAVEGVGKLPPVAALQDVVLRLTSAIRKTRKVSRDLSSLHGSLRSDGKAEDADRVSAFSADLGDAVAQLREGRSALVNKVTGRGVEGARSGLSSLEGLVRSLSAAADRVEDLRLIKDALQKIAGRLSGGLDAFNSAAESPEVASAVDDLRALVDEAGEKKQALEEVRAAEEAESQAKAEAAEPLASLSEKLAGLAAKARRVAECLQAVDAPMAGQTAEEAVSGFEELTELFGTVPSVEGVEPMRQGAETEAEAMKALAGKIAEAPVPGKFLNLAEDVNTLLGLLREGQESASALLETCKTNVPEPAGALTLSVGKYEEAVALAEEASGLITGGTLMSGREKLAAAVGSLQSASKTIEDMRGRMSDVFSRYILPCDADPTRPEETGLSLFKVGELVASLKAKHAILVFDASFAPGEHARGLGVLGDGDDPKNLEDSYVMYVLRRPGWTAIFAGGPGEGAGQGGKPHAGILTAALLKGMRGKADSDANQKVTLAELRQYLEQEVSSVAREGGATQTPMIRGGEGDAIAFLPSGK
ncbi:MAG: caspase family protein [Planctomycetota bacterium]